MSKKTKFAVLLGVIAAVVSAVILIIMFWDKLLEKCPCRKNQWEELIPEEEVPIDNVVSYTEEESAAFADLETD